jgi:hypothetical protein
MLQKIRLVPLRQGDAMTGDLAGLEEDVRAIQADIKTILRTMITRDEVKDLLASKSDRSEITAMKAWADERYRDQRGDIKEAPKTQRSWTQFWVMAAIGVLTVLLSGGIGLLTIAVTIALKFLH